MKMQKPRNQSIVLKGSPTAQVYRSFEDWQAEQQADLRTLAQRGIQIGSMVMWRYRADGVITTERAIVLAIEDQTLTLQVKGVEVRTCTAHVNEIVSSPFGHHVLAQTKRNTFIANQMETPAETSAGYSNTDPSNGGSWL
jgi:hypothetical protein